MTRKHERALLVGVGLKSSPFSEIKESLSELEQLSQTLGMEVVGSVVQILPQWTPATLIGSGKVEEIAQFVKDAQASVVVVDHVLSGAQTRNLEQLVGARVLDRHQLILDIFAFRAQSHEGKLQVELARLLDQMPRMVNAFLGSLSRQAGGIGTRGPGEAALESGRRTVRQRVGMIRKKLEEVRKQRAQHRAQRKRQQIISFAVIGYTNSGKSTLFNRLTQANVYTEDQLFATLDPTTRKVFLPGGPAALITDTVGFISNLPPQFVEAFKATLEETANADILIHVVDLANDQMARQMAEIDRLIKEFNWHEKPIIHVFNKVDKAELARQFQVKAYPRAFVSAKDGTGLAQFKRLMCEAIRSLQSEFQFYFPREEEYRIFDLGRESQITRKEISTAGTICYAQMTSFSAQRWKAFLATAP